MSVEVVRRPPSPDVSLIRSPVASTRVTNSLQRLGIRLLTCSCAAVRFEARQRAERRQPQREAAFHLRGCSIACVDTRQRHLSV